MAGPAPPGGEDGEACATCAATSHAGRISSGSMNERTQWHDTSAPLCNRSECESVTRSATARTFLGRQHNRSGAIPRRGLYCLAFDVLYGHCTPPCPPCLLPPLSWCREKRQCCYRVSRGEVGPTPPYFLNKLLSFSINYFRKKKKLAAPHWPSTVGGSTADAYGEGKVRKGKK